MQKKQSKPERVTYIIEISNEQTGESFFQPRRARAPRQISISPLGWLVGGRAEKDKEISGRARGRAARARARARRRPMNDGGPRCHAARSSNGGTSLRGKKRRSATGCDSKTRGDENARVASAGFARAPRFRKRHQTARQPPQFI